MLKGVSEILTSAVGVAISPVPIVAVTLMLFSQRARVNGPAFLVGWVVALVIVSGVAYILADQADAATDSTTADTIAWGKIVLRRRSSCCSGFAPGAIAPRPERSTTCRSGWPASTS